MYSYNEWKKANKIIVSLHTSDVILLNGATGLIGLKYNVDCDPAPHVNVIYFGDYTKFIAEVMRNSTIPCFEDKVLVNALQNLTVGELIPTQYYTPVAIWYQNVIKASNNSKDNQEDTEVQNEFLIELEKDIHNSIYILEQRGYKSILKKGLSYADVKDYKAGKVDLCYLEERIKKIAKENSYNLTIFRNSAIYHCEYIFDFTDEYGNMFNHNVFISKDKKRLIVGNEFYIIDSNLDEEDFAVVKLNSIIKYERKSLGKTIKKFCDEFKINKKQWEIASSGMTSIIRSFAEKNECGIIFDDTSKTVMSIYREKKSADDIKPLKMYEICITYNEYLRNPTAFKNMIENPKISRKWNFWCNEKKNGLPPKNNKVQENSL